MLRKGHYDAIVIGLGGVGSFALKALAERCISHVDGMATTSSATKNLRILGIEQFTPGHRFGTCPRPFCRR
jgi:hypothetical protein